jgi:excisionase family DNA binding protein
MDDLKNEFDCSGRLLLRVDEAGKVLGYSRASMYAMIRRGEIPVVRLGTRGVRIHVEGLRELINGRVSLSTAEPNGVQP